MKRYFLLIIALLFILSGCTQSDSVDNPYEVKKGTKTLSYYDTKDDIDINDFQILINDNKNWIDNIQDTTSNNIIVNEDGVIRIISIVEKNVVTYRGISVGDDISKIEQSFDNIYISDYYYSLLFNGNIEEDPTTQEPDDNWICIIYDTEDSKITRIQIADVKCMYKFDLWAD